MSNYYFNLLSQAQKLYRHNRQGSYRTKERYFEAYKRFLRFVGEEYHLQKLSNISGKHLAAYVEHMQKKGYAASTIKTDLAAIRFWQDQVPGAKYTLPANAEWYEQFRKEGMTDSEAKRRVSKLLGHEREDVTRIYLANTKNQRLLFK